MMLVQSDASGPGFEPGFESYLTGYPLPELRGFVLARTWHAPEMRRPGCVWTHSLVVQYSDLARLTSAQALLGLFRRPTPNDLAEYEKTLDVPVSLKPEPLKTSKHLLRVIVSSLYESAEAVYVQANSSDAFADAILAVWDQQWPRLRRGFSFSTGSLATREINGKPFDLQVVPRQRLPVIRRSGSQQATVVSGDRRLEYRDGADEWLSAAVEDLTSGDPRSEFRSFLLSFGSDFVDGRRGFRPLVEAYLTLTEVEPGVEASRLLSDIGELFPEPHEAVHLKSSLLGVPRPLVPTLPEEVALRAVFHLPNASPYKLPGVAYGDRLRTLWDNTPRSRSRYLEVWAVPDLNDVGQEAVRKLFSSVPAEELIAALPADPKVVNELASVQPDLLLERALWRTPIRIAGTAAKAVAKRHGPGWTKWRRAVQVAWSEGAIESMLTGASPLGPFLTKTALDVASSAERKPFAPAWAAWLRHDAATVWTWLGANLTGDMLFLASILEAIPPRSAAMAGQLNMLKALARRALQDASQTGDLVLSYGLAVALMSHGPDARDLAELCFARVHNAVSAGRLPPPATAWLGDAVNVSPASGKEGGERLRRALAQRFESEKWPWASLVDSVAGAGAAEQIWRFLYGTKSDHRK